MHLLASSEPIKFNLSSDCYIGLVTVVAVDWRMGGLEAVGS